MTHCPPAAPPNPGTLPRTPKDVERYLDDLGLRRLEHDREILDMEGYDAGPRVERE